MVKVSVITAKRASVARLACTTALALGLAFAPEACTLPKFNAGSGEPGAITPQPDTPPKSDTAVVPSSRKKKHKIGDVILVYVLALLVVAIIILETKMDEPT